MKKPDSLKTSETIAAISTPPGNGAIGVIRLSGDGVVPIVEKLWRGKTAVRDFEPRRAYVGKLETANDVFLDEALLLFLKAPHSYTGEDLIEIQAHGSQRSLENILHHLILSGATLAAPGEFTRRAFLHGRMDLLQAEAVADLIQARSEKAAQIASQQIQGKLSEYIGRLRNELKVMRAQMEAMIDFPEDEDVQGLRYEEVIERAETISSRIQSLLDTYQEGRAFREGVRVAILGKPNVGKSSLLNALLQENRAIVDSTPGTTRDLVEEVLEIRGLCLRLIDTAGIRQGADSLESEGIRRAVERSKHADLILLVVDSSQPLTSEDDQVFDRVKEKKIYGVYNKTDLAPGLTLAEIKNRWGDIPVYPISTKEDRGIEALKEGIFSHFVPQNPNRVKGGDELILTHLRHKTALERGLHALDQLKASCLEKRSLELLVADLTQAMNPLGEITGEVTHDEILGEIFSKFCIGK